jgi:hypothetical protein
MEILEGKRGDIQIDFILTDIVMPEVARLPMVSASLPGIAANVLFYRSATG